VTRAEFNTALEDAIQKAERAQAYTGGRYEIALIVTRDVYRFLTEYTDVTVNTRNTNHGAYNGLRAVYHGFRIGVVNERGHDSILEPAMLGMEYYDWMEDNDIIVVGDENKLFQLESREPICFRDMELTVSFLDEIQTTVNATVTNAAVDTINETNAAGTVTAAAVNAARPIEMNYRDGRLFIEGVPIDFPLGGLAMEDLVGVTTPQLDWNTTGRATVDWFGAVPATAEPARPVRAQRPARPMASRAEEPLNPGDTKMLDEFLDSFAIKETLQHA
jgi:hypothetical protein